MSLLPKCRHSVTFLRKPNHINNLRGDGCFFLPSPCRHCRHPIPNQARRLSMYHYHDDVVHDPATPEQLAQLAALGLNNGPPISRQAAQALIRSFILTPRQAAFLQRLGVDPDPLLRRHEAHEQIVRAINQRRQMPPTAKQEWFLRQRGLWKDDLTRGEAFDLIGELLGEPTVRSGPPLTRGS